MLLVKSNDQLNSYDLRLYYCLICQTPNFKLTRMYKLTLYVEIFLDLILERVMWYCLLQVYLLQWH